MKPAGLKSSPRTENDGYVNDWCPWNSATIVEVNGETEGSFVGLGWYSYGADIYWSHPDQQLEFHCKTPGGWRAVFTLNALKDGNMVQVRSYGDDNAMLLTYPQNGRPTITTEKKADLNLDPKGKVLIHGEDIDQLVRRIIAESRS